ncbi:MAG: NADH-quinone oxidoreductase subunit NuoH [Gemmataceae bacterium]
MTLFGLFVTVLTIAVVFGVLQGSCAFMIYAERKIAAWMQDRKGPNRVGPWGLLQSIADGLKFLLKEDVIPKRADKFLYLLAPGIAVGTAMLAFVIVPFGPTTPRPMPPVKPVPIAEDASDLEKKRFAVAEEAFLEQEAQYEAKLDEYNSTYQFVIAPGLNIGLLLLLAISSLAVYAILLGGWSANNKYSMLGAIRASAQVVSYEIPMGMSLLGIVLLAGSLNPEHIIYYQGQYGWGVFYQPLAFLIFLVSAFAECNRAPFDLPEAEQELVGGYHTEYSAMKFALFFLGEYTHMITTSFVMVTVFFGGWHFPYIAGIEAPNTILFWALKVLVFLLKVTVFVIFYILIRWTLPRFRFDQLMGMAWKVLIPLALLNFVSVMIVQEFELSRWLLLPVTLLFVVGAGWIGTIPSQSVDRRMPNTLVRDQRELVSQ